MDEELRKYDEIRPFEPEELPAAYDRLQGNAQFQAVVKYLYPEVPFAAIAQKMHSCKTSLEFQKAFCYTFLKNLLAKHSTGCEIDATDIDNTRRYTFMSNHRDIVLDSAFLDKLLLDAGFTTTCEIAIGDNLLSLPWVKDMVRAWSAVGGMAGMMSQAPSASPARLCSQESVGTSRRSTPMRSAMSRT